MDNFVKPAYFLSYTFMIIMNTLASLPSTRFNGQSNADVSAKYPTSFTPAGFAFSIWGVIFAFLGVFVISLLQSNRNVLAKKLLPAFCINCFANGFWSLIFAYEIIPLTMIDMFVVLGTLAYIYSIVSNDIGFEMLSLPYIENIKVENGSGRMAYYWTTLFPFSIYLGWITVATTVNMGVFFSATAKWDWWLQGWWSAILATVVFCVGLGMLRLKQDIAYVGVLIWSLTAVSIKHLEDTTIRIPSVVYACLLGVAVLVSAVQQFRSSKIDLKSTALLSKSNPV